MRLFLIILMAALTAGTPALAERERGHLEYPPDPDRDLRDRDGYGGRFPAYGYVPPGMVARYACDSPRGLYPQILICNLPWREIPAMRPR